MRYSTSCATLLLSEVPVIPVMHEAATDEIAGAAGARREIGEIEIGPERDLGRQVGPIRRLAPQQRARHDANRVALERDLAERAVHALGQRVAAVAVRQCVGQRGGDLAVLVDHVMVAEGDNRLGMVLERGGERGHELGVPEIVVAEDRDILPFALGEAGREIGRHAEVARVAVKHDARIGERGHERRGIGRARIVVNDDLEIAIGLHDNARQSLAQITRPLVGRDEHADERHRSGARRPPFDRSARYASSGVSIHR